MRYVVTLLAFLAPSFALAVCHDSLEQYQECELATKKRGSYPARHSAETPRDRWLRAPSKPMPDWLSGMFEARKPHFLMAYPENAVYLPGGEGSSKKVTP